MSDVDELYALARRVLLDALDALGPHRGAIVLVGAQAVYLRVGEADLMKKVIEAAMVRRPVLTAR